MYDTECLGGGGQTAEPGDSADDNKTQERGVDAGMQDTAAGGDFQHAAKGGEKG